MHVLFNDHAKLPYKTLLQTFYLGLNRSVYTVLNNATDTQIHAYHNGIILDQDLNSTWADTKTNQIMLGIHNSLNRIKKINSFLPTPDISANSGENTIF